MSYLQTSIVYLKGVGTARAEMLQKELGIFTLSDLLFHFPFRYVDRSKLYKISDVNDDSVYVQLKGKITNLNTIGEKRASRLVATFRDESGSIELVWFKGIKWINDALKPGVEYVLFGKPSEFNGKYNFVHPELELVASEPGPISVALQPFYNTTEKCKARFIDSKAILKFQKNVTTFRKKYTVLNGMILYYLNILLLLYF